MFFTFSFNHICLSCIQPALRKHCIVGTVISIPPMHHQVLLDCLPWHGYLSWLLPSLVSLFKLLLGFIPLDIFHIEARCFHLVHILLHKAS
jgi:hypothetical protein